eukprot:98163_1
MSIKTLTVAEAIADAVCLSFCLFLLVRDCKKRKKQETDENNTYQKILNIMSLLILIAAPLALFMWLIVQPLYFICGYPSKIGNFCEFNIEIILTFYQIGRLQYVYMDRKNHSGKFGYSKWIFYLLYGYGFCLSIYKSTIGLIVFNYKRVNHYCVRNILIDMADFAVLSVRISYYTWDFLVLCMYVIKTVQMSKKLKSRLPKNRIKIIQGINMTLHKIIFLTILYEIVGIIVAYFAHYMGAFGSLAPRIKAIAGSLITYLLVKHNNDEYLKLLSIAYKSKICCCFNWLMKDSIQYLNESNEENETETKDKTVTIHDSSIIYETSNLSSNYSKELQPIIYVEQSERTVTHINSHCDVKS